MNRNETLHYFIRDEGVAGSNPATPTTFPPCFLNASPLYQFVAPRRGTCFCILDKVC